MSTTKPTTSHVESDTKPDADHLEIRKSNLSESDLGVEEISDLKYINLPPLLQHMTQEELRTLDKNHQKDRFKIDANVDLHLHFELFR